MSENIINWTFDQDATSKDPGDFSAGVPQLSFNVVAPSGLKLGDTVTEPAGGTVRSISTQDGLESITADSPLGWFNSWHTHIEFPTASLLSLELARLISLVGADFDVTVEGLPRSNTVTPSFEGNVWDHIKERLSAQRYQSKSFDPDTNTWKVVSTVNTPVTFDLKEATSVSTEINSQQSAPTVEIVRYRTRWGTHIEIYPGENDTPISADSGETVEVEVEISGAVSQVRQPQAYYVLPHKGPYTGTDGAFVVSDNEGIPLQPDEFYGLGGNLQVETTSDPSVIRVTFTAPRDPSRGPFSLLENDGYDSYNSLHITGIGVLQYEEPYTLHTGASKSSTGEELGTTVENRHIQDIGQVYDVGQFTARAWSGLTISCSVSGFPYTTVQPGDRFRHDNMIYRVESVSLTPEGASFTGLADAYLSDYSSAWAGKTMGGITYGTMYDTTLEGLTP